jgi:hypothetical protein
MNVGKVYPSISFNGTLRFRKITPLINNNPMAIIKDFPIDTKNISKISEIKIDAKHFARELGINFSKKHFLNFEKSIKNYTIITLSDGKVYRSDIPKQTIEKAYYAVAENDNVFIV